MRIIRFAMIVLPLLAASTGSFAQDAPARLRLQTEDIAVQPDGSSIDTMHNEMQVLTTAAAAQLSQMPITYDGTLQTIEVLDAYTLKPDGRKIPVDPSTIISQQAKAPDNPLVAIYSDQRQKIILFPNVEPGDTLIYTFRRSSAAQYPGHYALQILYRPEVAIEDLRITVAAPKSFALAIDAHGIRVQQIADGNQTTYSWNYSHPNAEKDEAPPVTDINQRDHVFLSSFRSYDDVAHAYAALTSAKIIATPEIQAEADQITSGILDRRAQAQAIYDWVASRVRYVAIALGTGGIVPHNADWVLTNLYGDCKDHAVLFASLLKAKGIAAELVLIDAGVNYSLPNVPEPFTFNHVIVWLPDFKLYADTTSNVDAFGTLPLTEYGKPVVHAVAEGLGRQQVPLVGKDLSIAYTVDIAMEETGRAEVHATTTATGPMASALRAAAQQIQSTGPDKVASGMLTKHNFPRATGTFAILPAALTPQYSLEGNFKTAGAVANQFFWQAVNALRPLKPPADLLMGPLQDAKIKDIDPTPCYSGRQTDDVSLKLAPGQGVTALPADISIKTDNLEYSMHWSRQGQTISLHREFIANVDQPICAGRLRATTADALARIRSSYEIPITLLSGSAMTKADFPADDKTVKPAGPDSAGISPTVQSGLASSPDAPHIDSLIMNDGEKAGYPSVIQQIVFHAPNGNAITVHFEIISLSSPAPPDYSTGDIRINTPQIQQINGTMMLANSGCGPFPTPYSVVKRVTIIDASGEHSNSIDYAIKCKGR